MKDFLEVLGLITVVVLWVVFLGNTDKVTKRAGRWLDSDIVVLDSGIAPQDGGVK